MRTRDVSRFNLGDLVYFAVDGDSRGMVTAIVQRQSGVTYGVTWDDFTERFHTDAELSDTRPFPEGGGAK